MVHRLKGLYVVAENGAALTAWLDHAVPVKGTKAREIDQALLVWLDQPMLPSEYPVTSGEVVSRLRLAGLGAGLDRLGAEQLQRIVVIFGAPSQNGPAFAAVVLKPKTTERNGRSLRSNGGIERGFGPAARL